MLILKRLAVWLLETLSEAVLVGAFLSVLAWADDSTFRGLLLLITGTAVLFMVGSGYLLTTAIFGVVWRSQRLWLYPAVAAVLFISHVQFYVTGWETSLMLQVQAGGACIVFACTFVGNCILRKWVHAGGK